ncbi:MAG: hypothetical protein HRT66_09590 [Flavobacteriaceae bacterium]|nr:hypothetical protein [Flavobacteriaceae bacterium]
MKNKESKKFNSWHEQLVGILFMVFLSVFLIYEIYYYFTDIDSFTYSFEKNEDTRDSSRGLIIQLLYNTIGVHGMFILTVLSSFFFISEVHRAIKVNQARIKKKKLFDAGLVDNMINDYKHTRLWTQVWTYIFGDSIIKKEHAFVVFAIVFWFGAKYNNHNHNRELYQTNAMVLGIILDNVYMDYTEDEDIKGTEFISFIHKDSIVRSSILSSNRGIGYSAIVKNDSIYIYSFGYDNKDDKLSNIYNPSELSYWDSFFVDGDVLLYKNTIIDPNYIYRTNLFIGD